MGEQPNVTALLRAWSAGDPNALDALMPALHGELRRVAARYMARERKDHTLEPSALINEAFLRLIDLPNIQWQDRAHFFAVCAQIMRRILINYAVARSTAKRGAAPVNVPVEAVALATPDRTLELIELDRVLEKLAALDPRKARIVELRFFGGLSVDETAAVLKVSPQTVLRDWSISKSWLAREMGR
ncbi:MAG: sigma-70 family RNA polymerase sigma factor [Bryobacterales bacterium]|nr:sigma-70 family RNA polymerase sigma factor [Bryobacterales bacterium]